MFFIYSLWVILGINQCAWALETDSDPIPIAASLAEPSTRLPIQVLNAQIFDPFALPLAFQFVSTEEELRPCDHSLNWVQRECESLSDLESQIQFFYFVDLLEKSGSWLRRPILTSHMTREQWRNQEGISIRESFAQLQESLNQLRPRAKKLAHIQSQKHLIQYLSPARWSYRKARKLQQRIARHLRQLNHPQANQLITQYQQTIDQLGVSLEIVQWPTDTVLPERHPFNSIQDLCHL